MILALHYKIRKNLISRPGADQMRGVQYQLYKLFGHFGLLFSSTFIVLDFQIFGFEHLMHLINIGILIKPYYYHWVDSTAGGLLVPEGITSPL